MDLIVDLEASDFWAFQREIQQRRSSKTGIKKVAYWALRLTIFIAFGIALAFGVEWLKRSTGFSVELMHSLFFALAINIILFLFYFLRIRRELAPQPDGFILGKRKIQFTEFGIIETTSSFKAEYSWSAIIKISEHQNHIYLMMDSVVAHIIPKRLFTSKTDVQHFLSAIRNLRDNNLYSSN